MRLDLVTLLLGLGLALVLVAVLRALWGLSGLLQRSRELDAAGPFGWDPARSEGPGTPPARRDRPPELAALDEPAAGAPEPAEAAEAVPDERRERTPEPSSPTPAGPGADPESVRIARELLDALVRSGGPLTVEELASAGPRNARTLAPVLARLVAGGALRTTRSPARPGARPGIVYQLTPAGRAIAEAPAPGPSAPARGPRG